MKKIIIAFVPVLHEGYRRFLASHHTADTIFILGSDVVALFPHLAKEIRMLSPELIKQSLQAWPEITCSVEILSLDQLTAMKEGKLAITMPDEDIMRQLAQEYFSSQSVISFDSVFLRWDKHNTVIERPVSPDIVISTDDFDKKMILVAQTEAEQSSDWWRRVGGMVVKENKIILAGHNHHVPSPHTPYTDGDPRNNFHKGDHLELSTAIHAEASLVAEAARRGLSLEGGEMYVNTFPCPPCAKLIAYSGIKKLYYRYGYGVLDGESILKNQGVEIIFVEE